VHGRTVDLPSRIFDTASSGDHDIVLGALNLVNNPQEGLADRELCLNVNALLSGYPRQSSQ